MSYDFFIDFQIERENPAKSKKEIDELTTGSGKYAEVKDILSRINLLTTVYGVKCKLPDKKNRLNKIDPEVYAKVGEGDSPSGLKALIHSNGNYNDYIAYKLSELNLLGINISPDISSLPEGSWLIEFPITIAKPFISKDDVPLYIIENPVRKDKVFAIPFTSAMAWKGNLRWTMMKVHLEPIVDEPEKFAETRFQHTLLFGTEKGMEEKAKGWTKYLDELCPSAKELYQIKLKELKQNNQEEIPNITGMLYFYPTFWNRIGMEVINPHDRKTKTGKNPIYYEVVPEGATGFFRLLYLPFYYLGKPLSEIKARIFEDLNGVVAGIKAMMLTYGFSAKKSSGYGVIKDGWDKKSNKLVINGILEIGRFGNFEELKEMVKNLGG
jgi:CRISPR-associated protein Cmr2